MIKVLIVDDEPKLREGMRTLIPWEEEGYTVVATAANGYEALDKFREPATWTCDGGYPYAGNDRTGINR